MKKIISLLAMAIMVLGLSACLDPQDESGGKLPSKEIPSTK